MTATICSALLLSTHENDYTGANAEAENLELSGFENHYNGAVKAMRWHSPADGEGQNAYAFQYDRKYQLKDALFGDVTTSASATSFVQAPLDDYRESITEYNPNGNIKGLLRKGHYIGESQQVIADYQYKYVDERSNRLGQIDEVVNGEALPMATFGYDAIGQMISRQENGQTIKTIYNAYGLVSAIVDVTSATQEKLLQTYAYDDRGVQVSKTLYEEGVVVKTLWYVHDAGGNLMSVYEQSVSGDPLLAEVPFYGMGRLRVYKPTVNTYFYEVTDHLGNVRGVIGQTRTERVTASFEDPAESDDFLEYNRFSNNLYDHTDEGGKAYTYAHLLNGGYNGQIGMARSFEVSPGDVFTASVLGKI